MRSEVEAALEEPDGRSRLLAVAGRYIDDEGNWPTDRATNEFLARQFVQSTTASVGRRFGGAGLSQTTVAGLAGGAISVGASKGAVILGSNLLANYWQESMAYATGLSPSFYSAVFKVFKKITKDTHWEQLAKDLTGTSGPSSFDMVFGNGYEKMLEKELLGVFSKTAWRGARSAANHFAGTVGSHGTENGWIQNYVKVFAASQKNLTERTISTILAEGAEQALSERLMAGRLKMLWGLTPRHAKAVENYRRGLASQDRTPASIHKLVQRYADRLQRSRIKALSDTEVLTAFNLARERQWASAVSSGEMPVDTMKMWVTAKDELVCKVCRPLDGKTAPLGQAFESDLITIYAPAAHPNCRCIIVPVRTSVANFGKDHTFIFPGTELVEKRLIRVESYEKEDGTKVDAHFRNLEGEDRSEDLRKLKDGGYDMPLSWLRNHIRGSGIRLGQNNRVRSLANSIIENGFTKPITMWIYDDGPFIKDGMHRLEAANMIGFERIPVAIMHVEGNKPKTDIRGRLAARRIRNQTPQQRVDTPFKNVKQEQRFVRWFNNRMSNRGERIAEGEDPPRRKRRPLSKADDRPVLFGIEKHLIGQHDQDTHGRDKHAQMDFGGSSGSDALYAAGAAALAIGLRKLGAGEILNKAFKLKSVKPTKAPKYDAADEMAALEAHRAKSVTDDIWLDTDTWKLGLSEDLAALRTAPNYAISAKVQTSTAMFKDALRTATGRSEDLFEEMGAMTMSTKHVSSIGRTKAAEPVNLKSLREAMSKHHALNDDVNNLTRRVDRMKLAEESDEYFKFSHTARQYTGYFEEAKRAREYMQTADAVSDPALDRFFAAIAEAPKVNRPLYRGVQMPTNSAKGQQWMRPGETFELPISSFSDDFVSARGYSGGVSAAPKANHDKIVFRLQDAHGLDVSDHAQITQSMTQREFVTAGKFKVANVKNMDDGVTLVDLVQESVIDFAEDWSKIGFGKRGLFGIEKHLIGRHDQKTHGRDKHGGQSVVENVSDFVQYGSDEVELTSGQELALYGAAGIVSRVFFKQAVPLATVKSIKNPVQVLKRSKDFHGGLWSWVNVGSRNFRRTIEGTNVVVGKKRQQMIAFADGLDQLAKVPSPRVLHRGMVIPKSSKSASEIKSFSLTANDLKVGHSFDLAPSSFTTSKSTAKFFSESGSTKHGEVAVLLRVDRGHRSARVADVSPMPWEREYVGWGSYQITKVTKKSGHIEVNVKQTETYSLGDAIRKGIAKSDASGAPKAPSTGKYNISPSQYQALATNKSVDDLLASAKDAKKGGFKAAADEWEKMAEMKASGVPTTKPKLSDFDDQVEWLNALHDWQKMFLNSA